MMRQFPCFPIRPAGNRARSKAKAHTLTLLTAGVLALGLGGCTDWFAAGTERPQSGEAQMRLEEGSAFMEQGMMASALASFQLALQDDPKLVPAHVGIGDVYSDAGEYRLALRSYQQAVELKPDHFQAQFKVGQMYHFLEQVPEAIKAYLKALTLDPSSFDANHYLAAAYMQSGRTAEALPFARKATEIKRDSQEAWGHLAESLRVTGRYEEAVDAYRAALDLGELKPELMIGMARSLIEIKEYERAINVLGVLDHKIGGLEVLERWGFALFQMGRFREALERFDLAIERGKADENPPVAMMTRAYNGRGVCLMSLYIQGGQRDRRIHADALEAWRQSLRLDGNQPRIQNLLAAYQRG